MAVASKPRATRTWEIISIIAFSFVAPAASMGAVAAVM
jgi:hypothetical protein